MLFEMEMETNQAKNEIKEVFEDKLVLIEEKKQFDTCEMSEIETIMRRDEIKEAFDKDLSTEASELNLIEETKNFEIRELETNKQRKRGTQDDKVEENKESFLIFEMEFENGRDDDIITKQSVEKNEHSDSEMEYIDTDSIDTYSEDSKSYVPHPQKIQNSFERLLIGQKGICFQDFINTRRHLIKAPGF